MFKRALVAASVAAVFAAPAFADVTIGGSAEMDFMYRTNQNADGDGKFLEEIAIVVNVSGSDKLDNGATLEWKLAQKVATDYRYDSWGQREAWIGYKGDFGSVRFGNQFSNFYLMQDWPYGWKGQGNLWADAGAHFVQYPRAVSYFSPDFSGFNFAAQYDLGSGDGDAQAYEITANYSVGGLSINGGYTKGENMGLVGTEAVNYGRAGWPDGAWGAGGNYTAADNEQSAYMIGARYVFGDFNITGAYKHNEWTAAGVDTDNDQWLIRGGYNFGKHALNLGYQLWDDLDGVDNSSVQQIAFEWDYSLSKNSVAFLQIRYQDIDQNAPFAGYQVDGWNGIDDNVTRVLVGTWTGF
ncbi:porin [Chitiniphilus shinanonensis]|uniref:porin n=1 Tax=Chitiniphilus shinanonensis TaxID=553088 RepID=UPI0030224DFF